MYCVYGKSGSSLRIESTDSMIVNTLLSIQYSNLYADLDAKALRLALVKMIAIVVGSPPKASHLWFHMFQPEDLQNTYITGFLVHATHFCYVQCSTCICTVMYIIYNV